jgi:hypothetical protein
MRTRSLCYAKFFYFPRRKKSFQGKWAKFLSPYRKTVSAEQSAVDGYQLFLVLSDFLTELRPYAGENDTKNDLFVKLTTKTFSEFR